MRRFRLLRHTDISGVSGIGIVAEGVLFDNGQVALAFMGDLHAVEVLENMKTVDAIHGHGGATSIVWVDAQHNEGSVP